MAKRHGVVPIADLKKKRRVRTFANALDSFEPLAHKAPTAGHEMPAPLRAGEDANRIRCDVTGDFLERKPVSDAERDTVMRFYDMTRHKRTLSYRLAGAGERQHKQNAVQPTTRHARQACVASTR
jgi:NAD+ synthase